VKIEEERVLLKEFSFRVFPPDCNVSSPKLNAIAELSSDIAEIFPYLNGLIKGCIYIPESKTLSFRKDGRLITLRPRQIAVTKLSDEKEAERVFHWLKELINVTYEERETLKPHYRGREPIKVLDIFKLLPRTNCRGCGEPTCMAFAAKLQQDEIPIHKCGPLFTEPFKEKRERLYSLLREAGYVMT
jgi:ArsR family metal-binding transcriptional regulator